MPIGLLLMKFTYCKMASALILLMTLANKKGSSGKWSDIISKGVLTKTTKTLDCWQTLWIQSVFA